MRGSDNSDGEEVQEGMTSTHHFQFMKLFTSIAAAAAVIGTSPIFIAPANAGCVQEGYVQLGSSNRCVPADRNNHEMMKEYCTRDTNHYGRIALSNGVVSSLQEWYADCMGSSF